MNTFPRKVTAAMGKAATEKEAAAETANIMEKEIAAAMMITIAAAMTTETAAAKAATKIAAVSQHRNDSHTTIHPRAEAKWLSLFVFTE